MKHENFYAAYQTVLMREVKALNDALQNMPEDKEDGYPAMEYHFTDFPHTTCCNHYEDEPTDHAILAVKYPITSDSGILVRTLFGDETLEIGYSDINYGDIDMILGFLPEN